MVQLIIGNKGRGKTRYLLEKVNSEVKDILGNICYLDKSSKHMFELNNRVRLINVSDFAIENTDQFIGFICGIISQDHDLEQMYFDSFLKIAHLEGQDITDTLVPGTDRSRALINMITEGLGNQVFPRLVLFCSV